MRDSNGYITAKKTNSKGITMLESLTATSLSLIALDLVAICLLVIGVYFPRHRRMDLLVAFFGVNLGVLAVSMILASTQVSAGLGLGLFGVLSIIRLRSTEISQREVAYYFASLALGLITGMSTTVTPLLLLTVALIVGALAVMDAPFFQHTASQTVVLDCAVADETELRHLLAQRLGAHIVTLNITRLDYINDSTVVDVRFRQLRGTK